MGRQGPPEKHQDQLTDGVDTHELPAVLTKLVDEVLQLRGWVLGGWRLVGGCPLGVVIGKFVLEIALREDRFLRLSLGWLLLLRWLRRGLFTAPFG